MINDATISTFRTRFGGSIVEPDDATYDKERSVFNAMIDKRPRLIAKCATVTDVQDALAFARDSGLEIAVRAGGHSVGGVSLNDGGIVIDLRQMNLTEVDPAAKTIKVGGGTIWGEFDAACAPHNLAATGGRVTTTGVAGLTLGGGSGWMERRWGLACDNLIEVELVTVDGGVVRASEDENPELFWGLHGGGGNFGIATSLTFRLHPISVFSGGLLFFDPEDGHQVLGAYRGVVADAPDTLGGGFGYLTAPPEEFIPAELHGTVVAGVFLAFEGAEEELRALIKPVIDAAELKAELVMALPYHEFNGMLDDPPGYQNWWTADYHDDLPDAMIEDFCSYASQMKPSSSQMVIFPWGGKVAGRTDLPMTNRHSRWVSHPFGVWEDPAENEERIAWTRGLAQELRKYSNGGTYLNFIGAEGQERVIAAFGPDNYKRLAALKAEYDPKNLLRGNQNIVPQ